MTKELQESKRPGHGKLLLVLYVIFAAVAVFLLFYHLTDIEIIKTDEASHGADAYEMLAHGNALINTNRYEVDYYAAKPPLGFWSVMTGYKLFGYNTFGMRFPAAFEACILLAVVSFWLWKRFGALSAVFFTAAFPMMTAIYQFHGFRSGDMDSLYCLFFTLAMIALYETREHPRALVWYGLSLSLAFLTKSTHAVMIFLIGVLYIPVIRKSMHVKTVLAAAIAAAIPAGVWAIARYQYDGMAFLYKCIIGESKGQQTGVPTAAHLQNALHSPVWQLLGGILLVSAITWSIRKRHGMIQITWKRVLMKWVRQHYLLLLWTAVPMFCFSIIGAGLGWYCYPCYIAAAVLAAQSGSELGEVLPAGVHFSPEKETKVKTQPFPVLLLCIAVFTFSMLVSVQEGIQFRTVGQGGIPVVQFGTALKEFRSKYGDQYSGYHVYIENNDNKYKALGQWENDYVCYAELDCDFICKDGGVAGFLEEPGSLLCLDSDLWAQYSGILAGHVILEDNSYLILSSDMY